jgi:hypothetical protein
MIQYPAIVNPTQTITRTIKSAYVNQEYLLFISLPESYAESDKMFPALYLLDGNGTFGLVKPIVEILQVFQNVPSVIIVAVGYPQQTYMETLALRGRDLTPVELTPEQKAETSYPFEETGGASRFFAFIVNELVPTIERDFRTDPDDRALAGLSLSATFVLYALFQKPTLFKRMIAVSPNIGDILNIESQYANENSSLPVRLFWGVEWPSEVLEAQWIEESESFVKRIRERNYEGLEIGFRIFEGINHPQSGPIGFAHALKEIYQE